MTIKPILPLLLALALAQAGFAAEAPAPVEADNDAAAPPAEATGPEEADPIIAEAESNSGSTTPTRDDTFVPSVRISEDLSVSFPADI